MRSSAERSRKERKGAAGGGGGYGRSRLIQRMEALRLTSILSHSPSLFPIISTTPLAPALLEAS
jgi:hypothetical protein